MVIPSVLHHLRNNPMKEMLLRNKPYERDAFCKTHPMKEMFLSNQAA